MSPISDGWMNHRPSYTFYKKTKHTEHNFRIYRQKLRCYQVQKFHDEQNKKSVRYSDQNRTRVFYLHAYTKQSVVELINKKTTTPAEHLQNHQRPSSYLTKFTLVTTDRWCK